MALRSVPIHPSGTRITLFMGADRELVMVYGLMTAPALFLSYDVMLIAVNIIIYTVIVHCLRLLAKYDPLARKVYMRNYKYKKYYPARSTPYRRQPDLWFHLSNMRKRF